MRYIPSLVIKMVPRDRQKVIVINVSTFNYTILYSQIFCFNNGTGVRTEEGLTQQQGTFVLVHSVCSDSFHLCSLVCTSCSCSSASVSMTALLSSHAKFVHASCLSGGSSIPASFSLAPAYNRKP